MRLHFTAGSYDRRCTFRCRQSFQFSGIQILFADHVHRRSGVYNKFSFLFFRGWWRKQAPIFRKWEECCFIFSFNFMIFLANFHAASRAHRSCHSVSSWDRSSNFGALGLRWWGSPGQIIPSDGCWSRVSAWRNTALVNRTHRIGFSMFELFRKIDEDFDGSISWNTQPNCRAIFFTKPLHFCHHSFYTFLSAVHQPDDVRMSTFLQICIHFLTCRTGGCHFSQNELVQVPLRFLLAGQSKHSFTGTSSSGAPGSRRFLLILPRRRSRRKIRLCRFCTLICIVSETAIVFFRTLPVSFPLSTISQTSLFTLFCPLILDHGVCLIISVSGFKILNS